MVVWLGLSTLCTGHMFMGKSMWIVGKYYQGYDIRASGLNDVKFTLAYKKRCITYLNTNETHLKRETNCSVMLRTPLGPPWDHCFLRVAGHRWPKTSANVPQCRMYFEPPRHRVGPSCTARMSTCSTANLHCVTVQMSQSQQSGSIDGRTHKWHVLSFITALCNIFA